MSLFAIAECQSTSVLPDTPLSRAGSRLQGFRSATGVRHGWTGCWLAANCEGATPSSRRNMSLKLLGE
ncbi:hypothetical protein C1X35_30875 [Pseudomonas sp. FW306-1C-G01A]|nr:hypothetical protein C1X56_30660 [Pseudomonas sp. GW101-1A09]PMV87670.1 hypothetical protein C1X51_27500 [Pseudomonas sp. FW306-2-2C-B10A]PMV97958.1 hypothetical protein C1X55_15470 [Pseudomonas sp. GW460-C8]PMW03990.1 hypothetical protein C1X50_20175 [Pseudomonas sp. MPR-TSA4]PMW08932.1 hypothetical protein C1X52_27505 [Pseudomonas sp. FW306-2-1A-C05A]PMW16240.1 hypothetical protein C1X40_19470 [Pseudomonas sp. GW456-11-11-14-TSB2]PMW21852.1 hypothetical protein C1X53_15665 [Pseudomonas s